jgi:hypothetical protein
MELNHRHEAINKRLQIFIERFTFAGQCSFEDFFRGFAAVEQRLPEDFELRKRVRDCLKARGMLRNGDKIVEGGLNSMLLYPFLHQRV